MPMRDDRKLLNELGELVRFGANAREEEATPASADSARARFLRAAIAGEERRGIRLPRYAPATIVLAVAAIVVWFGLRKHDAAIGYAVDGAADAGGGFVRASLGADAVVRFTDGSSLDLAPGATGRVTTLRAKGARFSIEGGSVTVHVLKRDGGADYDIDAGPYDVHVTGTRFGVSWNPASQAMRLRLDEGSVVVTGPHAEAGVSLRAGQTLIARADEGIRIAASEPSDGDVETGTPPVASVSSLSNAPFPRAAEPNAPPPDESAAGAPSAPSPSASADAPKHASWSERVAKGDFAGVLADADARGVDSVVGSAPLDDLMALADAARYARPRQYRVGRVFAPCGRTLRRIQGGEYGVVPSRSHGRGRRRYLRRERASTTRRSPRAASFLARRLAARCSSSKRRPATRPRAASQSNTSIIFRRGPMRRPRRPSWAPNERKVFRRRQRIRSRLSLRTARPTLPCDHRAPR